MAFTHYQWPPQTTEEADEWSYNHTMDAIAYAAGWTGTGQGYGPEATKLDWPECPGFDYDCGLPDWDCGIEEEGGYEYRTALVAHLDSNSAEIDGWELVATFQVNPEPELYDDDGSPCGHLYIGEHSFEAVYRRIDPYIAEPCPWFDRFDICEAWYLYLSTHHSGQGSEEYRRLSRLLSFFDPRPGLRDAGSLSENGLGIYAQLVNR